MRLTDIDISLDVKYEGNLYQKYFLWKFEGFLGGHLIAWRAGISFRQFGTLSIGIFLSNLDSRHLMTSPRTLLGQF